EDLQLLAGGECAHPFGCPDEPDRTRGGAVVQHRRRRSGSAHDDRPSARAPVAAASTPPEPAAPPEPAVPAEPAVSAEPAAPPEPARPSEPSPRPSRSSRSHTPCTGEQCRNSGQVMNTTTSATIASTLPGMRAPGKPAHQLAGSAR